MVLGFVDISAEEERAAEQESKLHESPGLGLRYKWWNYLIGGIT